MGLNMNAKERIELAEASLRCVQVAAVIAAQTLAIIGMAAHFKLELRAFWRELRDRARELKERLMPEEIKRMGRMWDEIEEVLKLCQL